MKSPVLSAILLMIFALSCSVRTVWAGEKSLSSCLEALPECPELKKMSLAQLSEWSSEATRIPADFEKVTIKVARGKQELALPGALYIAPGEGPRPLVVVLPGAFGCYKNHLVADFGTMLSEKKQFHVLLLSTRQCEEVCLANQVSGSGGYLEGRDLLKAVRKIKGDQLQGKVSKTGIIGMSLSGNDVVQALAADGAERPENRVLTAGCTISGAFNLQEQLTQLDAAATTYTFRGHIGSMFQKNMRALLTKMTAKKIPGAPVFTKKEIANFRLESYLEKICWPMSKDELKAASGDENLTAAEYLKLTDTTNPDLIARIKAPLFALHTDPDSALGQSQADAFAKAAKDRNPDLVVLRKTKGGDHVSLHIQSPEWFGNVIRSYFSYWLIDQAQISTLIVPGIRGGPQLPVNPLELLGVLPVQVPVQTLAARP